MGQVKDKEGNWSNSNRDRKKCIDFRTTVVRDSMWEVREVTIGYLEMIRRVVAPLILRTKREICEEENDFHLEQIDFNVLAGHSCVLKLGDSQIYMSSPEMQNGLDWTYRFENHQNKNCFG